jgi:hypothetical protein
MKNSNDTIGNRTRDFPATLDNKYKTNFLSVMNMLLLFYLSASMKLEKGHKKLLFSSFKIMLPL